MVHLLRVFCLDFIARTVRQSGFSQYLCNALTRSLWQKYLNFHRAESFRKQERLSMSYSQVLSRGKANKFIPTRSSLAAFFMIFIFSAVMNSAFAGLIFQECRLSKAFQGNRVGQRIDIVVETKLGNLVNFFREYCDNSVWSFRLDGTINSEMERATRLLQQAVENDSGFSRALRSFDTIRFSLNSVGGSVEIAIRMGRVLRQLNAAVEVQRSHRCFSSCVFLIAGAVDRSLLFGSIGIHRPYFLYLEPGLSLREVSAKISALDESVIAFFREMNVNLSLLDAMKGISPEEIKILSDDELAFFGLSSRDAVFDEMDTASQAWSFNTSSAELRSRRMRLATCHNEQGVEFSRCAGAILYGISREEFRRRDEVADRMCRRPLEQKYAKHASLRGPYNTHASSGELDQLLNCVRVVMNGQR
jgi:hypothetical protein